MLLSLLLPLALPLPPAARAALADFVAPAALAALVAHAARTQYCFDFKVRFISMLQDIVHAIN